MQNLLASMHAAAHRGDLVVRVDVLSCARAMDPSEGGEQGAPLM